jgi:hypothetical protein
VINNVFTITQQVRIRVYLIGGLQKGERDTIPLIDMFYSDRTGRENDIYKLKITNSRFDRLPIVVKLRSNGWWGDNFKC